MNIYSLEVAAYVTLYVKAADESEAFEKLKAASSGEFIEIRLDANQPDIAVDDGRFRPDMPEVSLSPAGSIHPINNDAKVEFVEELEG